MRKNTKTVLSLLLLTNKHALSYTGETSINIKKRILENAYENFVSNETNKRMKEDRKKIASKTTKNSSNKEGINTQVPKILKMKGSSDAFPSLRYKENERKDSKLGNQNNIRNNKKLKAINEKFKDEPSEYKISQQEYHEESKGNNFEDYLQDAGYEQDRPEEETYQQEERDQTSSPKENFSPDEEQSGSDNNEGELQEILLKPKTEDFDEDEYSPDEVEEDSEENFPILFLDVNLGKDKVERLVIYDGDNPMAVADEF